MYKLLVVPLIAYLAKLRFPTLFGITAVLFVVDFFIPDAIPFADETLLALGAALLGRWKKQNNKDTPSDGSGH